jgi:4-amino-4-deoxy-L-arabinose transferase-like glycosyltransferase
MIFKIAPARRLIWLLLLVTLVKGVVWSIIVPPWRAPDEDTHFEYAQIIERFAILHPDPGSWKPEELAILLDIAQIRPRAFDINRLADPRLRERLLEQVRRLDDPAIKYHYVYDDGYLFSIMRNFINDHPPLYYWLAGAIQASLEDKSILVRILFNRWLSVFLGVITVALAYRVGREIWHDDAWACFLATLVSFQPMMTFITAVVGDGALGIAMLSACTLLMLRVIRFGWTVRRACTLAILLGLGLLARTSLIIIIPLLMLILVWNLATSQREKRFTLGMLAPLALTLAIALLIAGWWYKSTGFDNTDTRINFFISGLLKLGANGTRFLTEYDWFGAYSPVLGWYWGNFGWLDTPMDQGLYACLGGITTIVVWSTLWWLLRRVFSNGQQTDPRQTFIISVLGIQTVLLVVLYTYLDFQFFTIGGIYRPQGRYFLPAIIGQMTWLVIGLVSPAPAKLRRTWMWFVALGMVALNIYSLFSVIALRYYGARNLLLVADRAAVLQPVAADSILILCAILFILIGAFILGLWRAFEYLPDSI